MGQQCWSAWCFSRGKDGAVHWLKAIMWSRAGGNVVVYLV
jgi:hypothetical protein